MDTTEPVGIFYMDDDFVNTFSYNIQPSSNIDMDKLDYRKTTKDYHFFKKKYPLFDDNIIEMLVELTIQEEKHTKMTNMVKHINDDFRKITTTTPPKKQKKKKQPYILNKTIKSYVVDFN